MDVGVEADRDAVYTERANRLVKLDLTFLDRESLGFELVRDIGGGNGSEELALIAEPRRCSSACSRR